MMISAILLAAGQSKRMGIKNKLITKYKKKYLINHILGTLIKSKIDKIVVVLGFESLKVKKIIPKSKKVFFIFNKNYKNGMASSIKIGLKNLSKKNHGFFIVHADMPLISKKIINTLCLALLKTDKKIIAPIYKNKIGNPIAFKNSMIQILNKSKKDTGAKKMIKKNRKNFFFIKVNTKSIFKDFNTEKDFMEN